MVSDDPAGEFANTRLVLQELSLNDVSLDDCRHVQHVCWQVSQRAACLAATGDSCSSDNYYYWLPVLDTTCTPVELGGDQLS